MSDQNNLKCLTNFETPTGDDQDDQDDARTRTIYKIQSSVFAYAKTKVVAYLRCRGRPGSHISFFNLSKY